MQRTECGTREGYLLHVKQDERICPYCSEAERIRIRKADGIAERRKNALASVMRSALPPRFGLLWEEVNVMWSAMHQTKRREILDVWFNDRENPKQKIRVYLNRMLKVSNLELSTAEYVYLANYLTKVRGPSFMESETHAKLASAHQQWRRTVNAQGSGLSLTPINGVTGLGFRDLRRLHVQAISVSPTMRGSTRCIWEHPGKLASKQEWHEHGERLLKAMIAWDLGTNMTIGSMPSTEP